MTTPGNQRRPDQRQQLSPHQFHSIDPRPPRLRSPYKPPPRSLPLAFIFSQRSNHSHDRRGAYSQTARRASNRCNRAGSHVNASVRRSVYFGLAPDQSRRSAPAVIMCRPPTGSATSEILDRRSNASDRRRRTARTSASRRRRRIPKRRRTAPARRERPRSFVSIPNRPSLPPLAE
jgi:hypothetical protein